MKEFFDELGERLVMAVRSDFKGLSKNYWKRKNICYLFSN